MTEKSWLSMGSEEEMKVDPIVQGLLARLPKSGSTWPQGERQLWLNLLGESFKLIYREDEAVK
jgi:hypothetical protein